MIPTPVHALKLDKSHIFYKVQAHGAYASVCIAVLLPAANDQEDQTYLDTFDWQECGIAWTLTPPTKQKDGPHWKTRDHFSMLPYGWIPEDGVDFFRQFIDNLKRRWLKLCDLAEEHLSKRVELTRTSASRGELHTDSTHSVLTNCVRKGKVLSLYIALPTTHGSGLSSAASYGAKFIVQEILLWNIAVATTETRI